MSPLYLYACSGFASWRAVTYSTSVMLAPLSLRLSLLRETPPVDMF
jgi:hypothetical protein